MSSVRDPSFGGIRLRSGRELVPQADFESWEDVSQSSTVEQSVSTQALVPVPSTVDFEESILLSELEEMESQLVPGGQLKFTGDLMVLHSPTCASLGQLQR